MHGISYTTVPISYPASPGPAGRRGRPLPVRVARRQARGHGLQEGWTANQAASEAAFASGIASDLGVAVSSIDVQDATASARRRLHGDGIAVPFTVSGFGANAATATAVSAGISSVGAASGPSALTTALRAAALPVSSLAVASAPVMSAALKVTVIVPSSGSGNQDATSAAASMGTSMMAAVSGGAFTQQLASAGITATAVVKSPPQTTLASPPPPVVLWSTRSPPVPRAAPAPAAVAVSPPPPAASSSIQCLMTLGGVALASFATGPVAAVVASALALPADLVRVSVNDFELSTTLMLSGDVSTLTDAQRAALSSGLAATAGAGAQVSLGAAGTRRRSLLQSSRAIGQMLALGVTVTHLGDNAATAAHAAAALTADVTMGALLTRLDSASITAVTATPAAAAAQVTVVIVVPPTLSPQALAALLGAGRSASLAAAMLAAGVAVADVNVVSTRVVAGTASAPAAVSGGAHLGPAPIAGVAGGVFALAVGGAGIVWWRRRAVRSASETRRARHSHVRKTFMASSSGDDLVSFTRGAMQLEAHSGSSGNGLKKGPPAPLVLPNADEEEPRQLRSPRPSRGGRPPRHSDGLCYTTAPTPRLSHAAHPRLSEAQARTPRRSEMLMLLAFEGGEEEHAPSPVMPRRSTRGQARVSWSTLETHELNPK